MTIPASTDPASKLPAVGEIHLKQNGPVTTLILNRPHKHNAMSLPMWDQLHQLVNGLQTSSESQVIVIRGAEQHFSAGGDLNEVLAATQSRQAATAYCRTVVRALHTVACSAIPTVSAINGVASGGGVEIAIATDVRIATRSATLQLPMTHLGVVPDDITLGRLRSAMGPVRTQWMLLHGRPVPAPICLTMGLVEEVADEEAFDTAVDLLANSFARTAPMARRHTRELLAVRLPSVEEAAVPMIESFLSGEVATAANNFVNRNRRPSGRV